MFIPVLVGLVFPQIFSLLATIFLIWMLIDCARNNILGHKVGWILFILCVQPIGGIVYFFARGPWPKVRNYLSSRRTQIYQAPFAAGPAREIYPNYEQGYQAYQADPVPTFQENEQHVYTPSALQPQYEQTLVNYPEMPPLQQF
jgi:Phospholipase_D-nuclease N-terminal